MKKIAYLSTLLLLLTMATSYGQDHLVPRLTAEEEKLMEASVEVNPARPQVSTQVDPRMDPAETVTGETNWRPAETVADERPVPEPLRTYVKQDTEAPSSSQDDAQPEGEKPTTGVRDHRLEKGNQTQPEAPVPSNVTDFRRMKGSDTQPEGEKPTK